MNIFNQVLSILNYSRFPQIAGIFFYVSCKNQLSVKIMIFFGHPNFLFIFDCLWPIAGFFGLFFAISVYLLVTLRMSEAFDKNDSYLWKNTVLRICHLFWAVNNISTPSH